MPSGVESEAGSAAGRPGNGDAASSSMYDLLGEFKRPDKDPTLKFGDVKRSLPRQTKLPR